MNGPLLLFICATVNNISVLFSYLRANADKYRLFLSNKADANNNVSFYCFGRTNSQ